MKRHICFGGCQWDAMMLWMYNYETEPYINIKSITPKDISTGNPTRSKDRDNIYTVTGATEDDKLANVYDLLGSNREWSMIANGSMYRMYRGGYYNMDGSPCYRGSISPDNSVVDIRFPYDTLHSRL